MKTIRAKFVVSMVNKTDNSEIIHAYPVYGGSDENKSFSLATPSGSLQMAITNPAAFGFFTPQQEFYLDFSLTGEKGN